MRDTRIRDRQSRKLAGLLSIELIREALVVDLRMTKGPLNVQLGIILRALDEAARHISCGTRSRLKLLFVSPS